MYNYDDDEYDSYAAFKPCHPACEGLGAKGSLYDTCCNLYKGGGGCSPKCDGVKSSPSVYAKCCANPNAYSNIRGKKAETKKHDTNKKGEPNLFDDFINKFAIPPPGPGIGDKWLNIKPDPAGGKDIAGREIYPAVPGYKAPPKGKETTNPASGCTNCDQKEGADKTWCETFGKIGCEFGHWGQVGGEGILKGISLPLLIGGGLVVLLLLKMR